MRRFLVVLGFLVPIVFCPPLSAKDPVFIAIIIDDLGNSLSRGKRAIEIPGSLTFAVLPYATYSEPLATTAKARGKEVMVHMPMANISHKPIGPGGLTPSMTRDAFLVSVARALENVPGAKGLNNHMGSYLTQQTQEMNWLMDEVKKRNLFFVDSRTTPKSVAAKIATQKSVFAGRRDVFLDNEQTFFGIDNQFQQLIRTAEQNGTAIAIGHPYPMTLAYLEMAIPQLKARGVNLIPASNLIAIQKMTRKMSELQFAAATTTAD